ncbi:MAG TPA: VOC family protein [Bacillota bacterium]|nr:VOC family protein [Bacillota bacterium]HPZ89998.1 VOC family protein [Bacillota bacterium]HQE01405.1 VOC family protein [Bacillota bacterium]
MAAKYQGLIVFLGVRDLEATDRFYSGLLGLKLWKDQEVCRIYEVPGGGRLGFCTHLPVTPAEGNPIITLLSADVDADYARLQQGGCAPLHPPRENSRFGIYHFFVRDPDGYLLEIQHFLD